MSKTLLCMTAAAALALSTGAMAASATKTNPPSTPQTPATMPPPTPTTTPPPTMPPASTGSATNTADTEPAAAPVPLSVGMPVKDNTGAVIGKVSDLKPDPSGAQLVTITMGTDSFAVDATKLAVADGAATINLTQQQLTDMLHKPK